MVNHRVVNQIHVLVFVSGGVCVEPAGLVAPSSLRPDTSGTLNYRHAPAPEFRTHGGGTDEGKPCRVRATHHDILWCVSRTLHEINRPLSLRLDMPAAAPTRIVPGFHPPAFPLRRLRPGRRKRLACRGRRRMPGRW